MEHKPLTELNSVADLKPALRSAPMTRRERLDRWAELLEREPDRSLKTLEEIEWRPKAERRAMRADGSPLSVAFADPVLRSEGLASDRLGDAVAFFQISEHEAHLVLCSCNAGDSIRAGEAARRIRTIRAPRLWSLYLGWAGF